MDRGNGLNNVGGGLRPATCSAQFARLSCRRAGDGGHARVSHLPECFLSTRVKDPSFFLSLCNYSEPLRLVVRLSVFYEVWSMAA
jgi:hypothetical protein